MVVLGSASNGEMSDMTWNSPSIRTGSSVELHLEIIWHEFQRMQQRIDSLGRGKEDLEELLSGGQDQEVCNEADLLQMVSSTVLDLERSSRSAVHEDACASPAETDNNSKVPEEVGDRDRGVEEKLREVKDHDSHHHSGLSEERFLVKEHSNERKMQTKPQGGGQRTSLHSLKKTKRSSVLLDERRRRQRLTQFSNMQDICGGAMTVESVQTFVADFAENSLDIHILTDSFKCMVEKSRAGPDEIHRPDSNVDTRTLDFPAFLLLLDLRELEERIVDESPEVQQCIATLHNILGAEANKIHHQELDKIKPRNLRGMVETCFDTLSIFVVLLNTLAVGVETDDEGNELFWEVVEILFFSFYLVEILVKARISGCSVLLFTGYNKFWNRLDVLLLLFSAVDLLSHYLLQSAGGISGLKVLRLGRLARLVRVMRFKMFEELKKMVLGLISGLRALAWAIVLLLFLVYLGGIILVSISDSSDLEYNTTEKAMFTLFRCFTDGCAAYDGTPLPEHLREKYGWAFVVSWILTTMVVTVGTFNLIMAVFIDDVTKSQQQRKQKELGDSAGKIDTSLKLLLTKFLTTPGGPGGQDKLQDNGMMRVGTGSASLSSVGIFTELAKARDVACKQKLAQSYFQVLVDDEVTISRDVFQMWLEDPEFTDVLEEAEVDLSAKAYLFDILDVDMGGELSADELVTGLMKLRGDVSKGDIVAIMLQVRHLTQQFEELVDMLNRGGKGTQDLDILH